MTDARLPERWLNDRRIVRLTDAAYRLFTVSLTWSVANRTDGHLQRDDLTLMLSVDKSASDELVRCGLWESDDDGWHIEPFGVTQTSRDQLDGYDLKKAQDRARAKAYRARKKPDSSRLSRDSSRDDIGQARTGQEGQAFKGEQVEADGNCSVCGDPVPPSAWFTIHPACRTKEAS